MKTKLVIFGITGDLSTRKLLPALEKIIGSGRFEDLSIIGVSRRELNIDQLLEKSIGSTRRSTLFRGFSMDMTQPDDYRRLNDFIALESDEQLLIYLSVPPGASSQIVEYLGQAGLNGSNVKLMLEKPFGIDLASAHQMIGRVGQYYHESQVYRIDHYLAKEMSQNIVAFRGGNALFDHIWDNNAIEKIEVVALEKIGIEGRAEFYEQTGALRDIVQGHLMQLLALTLMDIPHDFDWNEMASLRLATLEQIEHAEPDQSIRGQYDTYKTEVNNPHSTIETFASIQLHSTDPRWVGVPLTLATGKSMQDKKTEVRVFLKKSHEAQTNCIIFRIQPHDGVKIELLIKKPGYDKDFDTQSLSFEYPDDVLLPDAYEQVIVDAIRSDKSLFASGEEVIRSWEILTPVQQKWNNESSPSELKIYDSGSDLYTLIA